MTQSHEPNESAPSAAQKKLEVSRERLRQQLLSSIQAHPENTQGNARSDANSTASASPRRTNRAAVSLLSRFLMSAGKTWLEQHPLRPPVQQLQQVTELAVAPLIQKYPLTSVTTAALIGYTVMGARLWRWVPRDRWRSWRVALKGSPWAALMSQISLTSLVENILATSELHTEQARDLEPKQPVG